VSKAEPKIDIGDPSGAAAELTKSTRAITVRA
jgi:hypothetical protein